MSSCDIAAIGWIIALFGLLFNNMQANHRETRKETRSKIDQLNQSLTSLIDSSKNYYLDKNATLIKESVKIHETINTCERLVEEFSKKKRGIAIQPHFYIIFDLITGGNFESKSHRPGDHYAEHCKKISIQKELLVKELEDWFRKTFH